MKSSTIMHENVHKDVCQQYGFSFSGGTWKQQIGLVAVYENEMAAYTAELGFLEPLLSSLNQSCSGGWKGVITSTFTISKNDISPMQPIKPGLETEGSTTTYDRSKQDKWTFNGVLGSVPQFTQGIWSGTLTSSNTLVEDTAFLLGPGCGGKMLHGHLDIKNAGNGFGTGRADLIVTVAGPIAHVSVVPNENDPPGKIMSSRSQQGWADVVKNDCGHRVSSGSPNPVAGASEPFTNDGVNFDAPADPQHTNVLKGHVTNSPPGGGTTVLDWDLTLGAPSN
jgi:hypothetical protein